MNAAPSTHSPWYRVAEVWVIVLLLGATIAGTFVMMALATRQPDRHLTVPNDMPRPSKIPPITAPARTAQPPERDTR